MGLRALARQGRIDLGISFGAARLSLFQGDVLGGAGPRDSAGYAPLLARAVGALASDPRPDLSRHHDQILGRQTWRLCAISRRQRGGRILLDNAADADREPGRSALAINLACGRARAAR